MRDLICSVVIEDFRLNCCLTRWVWCSCEKILTLIPLPASTIFLELGACFCCWQRNFSSRISMRPGHFQILIKWWIPTKDLWLLVFLLCLFLLLRIKRVFLVQWESFFSPLLYCSLVILTRGHLACGQPFLASCFLPNSSQRTYRDKHVPYRKSFGIPGNNSDSLQQRHQQYIDTMLKDGGGSRWRSRHQSRSMEMRCVSWRGWKCSPSLGKESTFNKAESQEKRGFC